MTILMGRRILSLFVFGWLHNVLAGENKSQIRGSVKARGNATVDEKAGASDAKTAKERQSSEEWRKLCDKGERPCRQLCVNAEKEYLFKRGSQAVLEYPMLRDGKRYAADLQNCTWTFYMPPEADKGEVIGNLTIAVGENTQFFVNWGGKDRIAINSSTNMTNIKSVYSIQAPLPMSITFVSGQDPTGYYSFDYIEDYWIPPSKNMLMLMQVLNLTPALLALCILACLYVNRKKLHDWIFSSARQTFLRRLIPRAAFNEEEMDRLCPREEFNPIPGQTAECPVCLMDLEPRTIIRRMRCPAAHAIHAECAEGWLSRKGTCPVCRFDHIPLLPALPPREEIISLQEFARSWQDGEAGSLSEYSVLEDPPQNRR